MADFAISVFQLRNERGYASPNLEIQYQERGSDIQWRISCGGTRVYLVRIGESLKMEGEDQAVDSYYMVRRVTGALLLGGVGLFEIQVRGRLMFSGAYGDISWGTEPDAQVPLEEKSDENLVK